MQVCDVREEYTNGETRISERVNESKTLDWALLGTGVAFAGAGIATVADASHVYSSDKSSQNYNPVGPSNAQAIGFGLAAVGAALLVVPVVDALRAQGETRELVKVNEDGDVVESGATLQALSEGVGGGIDCARTGRLRGNTRTPCQLALRTPLGPSRLILEPIVPSDLRWTYSKYSVIVGTEKAAHLVLTPLVTIREARAWSALDRSKCSSPTTSTACGPIAEYLDQYSGGPHASEAQALLDAQGPTLTETA